MKLKTKKKVRIDEMPEHLRNAQRSSELKKSTEELEKILEPVPVPMLDEEFIDESAENYNTHNEMAKSAAKTLEFTKKDIFTVAETCGTRKGNRQVVNGKKFTIGYTIIPGEVKLSIEQAKKVLPPLIFKKVIKPVLDEKLVEHFVTKGIIPIKTLKQMSVSTLPHKRVFVRKKAANGTFEEEDEDTTV